jgi:hypothetical protein
MYVLRTALQKKTSDAEAYYRVSFISLSLDLRQKEVQNKK